MFYTSKPETTTTRIVFISLIFLFTFLTLSSNLIADSSQKIIALTQIVSHPAADKTREGILDALKEAGFEDGKTVKILYENPEGSMTTAIQIAQKFVSLKPDIIIPITTPSAQTVIASAKGSDIPIVFASVTDPIYVKIVSSLEKPGGMVTGASDFPPIEGELDLIKEMMPDIKNLGMIYNPAEVNAVKMFDLTKEKAAKRGINIIAAPVNQSKEVPQSTNSLVGKVDAIFVCLDNTTLSAMESLLKIAFKNTIPVFSSDPDSVEQGVLACLSNTQYQTGFLAGKIAIRVLNGEKPGDIPISFPEKAELHLNTASAKRLNFKIPETVLSRADKIVGEDLKK